MDNYLESAMEDCVLLQPGERIPDGQGGFSNTWTEGLKFKAAFDYQTGMVAKIGEAQGVTGMWNLLLSRSVQLVFHNVIKRKSDGAIFRITSKDDKQVPADAPLDLKLVSAEEWELV